MKVFWHLYAYESLEKNLAYLEDEWSVREINAFLDKIDEVIKLLKKNPFAGTIYEGVPLYRKILITEHVYMFYEPTKETLYIMLFWNNFQDPEKLKVFFP